MAIDRTSIERIRDASFPSSWAWRGYDKGEVEKFLDTLAEWLETNGGGKSDQDTSEQELSVQGEAIETLETRIKELERELSNAGRRERRLMSKLEEVQEKLEARKARSRSPTSATRARTKPAQRRRKRTTSSWARVPRGRLHANEASFEQFRALGLSVSQCARLIATRDIRGGFDSLDDLTEIEGLPPSAVRKLRERLTLGPGGSR
jgi:DivIVA domain-containing protein